MRYDIVRERNGWSLGDVIELDVLPTPRLIDEGTRGPVEAYRDHEWVNPHNGRPQGMWRVRDDEYDQPRGVTTYQRVMVRVTP